MKSRIAMCMAVMVTGVIAAEQTPPASESAAPAAEASAAPVAAEPAAAKAETRTDELPLEESDVGTMSLSKATESSAAPADENTLIDIDCDDATVGEIVRQFRKSIGVNIICSDSTNLRQRVSVSLHRVPWLQSLQSILNTRNFRLESRDGIYFVSEDKVLEPVFTRTYALNHASAEELVKMFNENYGVRSKDGKVTRGVASAFPGANVIVVTANEKTLHDCEAIIKAVDKAVAQIYIEARFIEASTEAMHKLGMQWNSLESWGATVHDLTAGAAYHNGRSASYGTRLTSSSVSSSTGEGGAASGSSSSTYETILGTGVGTGDSGSKFNRSAEDMSWRNARGFSGQLSVDDFRLALSAFESQSDVKIFSNPKIIVSNGKEARVDMTTKFPNVKVQATRNTSNGSDSLDISTQLEVIPGEDKLMFAKEAFYSWGIMLSVKPRISPNGLINVEIVPTISQLDDSSITGGTGFYQVSGGEDSAYSAFPVIDVKRLTTDFTMSDGATAVIGGLSRTTEEDIDSGIPYLRKIPWIGPKLFGWKSRGKVQKEVVVFVTIGIADPANLARDVGLPKNAVVGREYVDGRRLEPGDRDNAPGELLKLDTTSIDDRIKEDEKPVVIIRKVEDAKPEAEKPAEEKSEPLANL